MASCYVTVPSWGIEGPAHRERVAARARALCLLLGWDLVPSPLLDAWTPGWGTGLPVGEREADLQRALAHDAVYAACGGAGAIHLVPALLAAQPARPPLLIGYSDNTVLHACWLRRGWRGGVYTQLMDDPAFGRCGLSLPLLLRGEALELHHRRERSVRVLRPGGARGPLAAGCLSVLAGLAGTDAMPCLDGWILAVEDVDERPYRLDGYLAQLHLSGALDGLIGLVGGAFAHDRHRHDWGPTADEVLQSWAERLGVPCLSRLPFGHIEDHYALPQGRETELECAADGSWRLGFAQGGEASFG
jgi:muramoyltetrapeptide carboxypeptidase